MKKNKRTKKPEGVGSSQFQEAKDNTTLFRAIEGGLTPTALSLSNEYECEWSLNPFWLKNPFWLYLQIEIRPKQLP